MSFHENACKSSNTVNCTERLALLSDYRNVSSDEGFVGLQEAEDSVYWGWTTQGEWLLYTVTVSMHSMTVVIPPPPPRAVVYVSYVLIYT